MSTRRYPLTLSIMAVAVLVAGFFGLKASVNQRSIVPSPSGSSEFALRTASMRGPHASLAPGMVWGDVSHSIREVSLLPWAIAKA